MKVVDVVLGGQTASSGAGRDVDPAFGGAIALYVDVGGYVSVEGYSSVHDPSSRDSFQVSSTVEAGRLSSARRVGVAAFTDLGKATAAARIDNDATSHGGATAKPVLGNGKAGTSRSYAAVTVSDMKSDVKLSFVPPINSNGKNMLSYASRL
ncbi:hypothetical protein Dimus_030463 [Dionaea muscipula]